MYSCLYNTCADINLFLCVCRDGLWHTWRTSFLGLKMMPTTLLLPCLWVNGNLPGVFLILDTTELPLICWTILMSPGGRTRDDNTSRPFRTYAGAPDGSWPAATRWSVTCQSEFLGSTSMSNHDPGLLHTLMLLRQMMWPRSSRSLLYMSSTINRGVIRFRITSRGLILGGTWDGSLEYHILLWTPLRPFLTMQLMPLHVLSLLTGWLLLSSSKTSSQPIPNHQQHQGQSGCAMGHPDVFRNPEEVMRLMQGIQFEWSMLEQMLAPRRRSRNPRDGPVWLV